MGARLREARRTGRAIYTMEWDFAPPTATTAEHIVQSVLAWCRETLGQTRRPWGIADFDLAIAVNDGGSAPRSTRFLRLQPADAYAEDGLEKQLKCFLSPAAAPEAPLLSVAVALFSWGDAIHSVV